MHQRRREENHQDNPPPIIPDVTNKRVARMHTGAPSAVPYSRRHVIRFWTPVLSRHHKKCQYGQPHFQIAVQTPHSNISNRLTNINDFKQREKSCPNSGFCWIIRKGENPEADWRAPGCRRSSSQCRCRPDFAVKMNTREVIVVTSSSYRKTSARFMHRKEDAKGNARLKVGIYDDPRSVIT